MTLTDLTPYDAVRAILGVSAKELKDTTLALDLWVQQFVLEMGDVDQGGGKVMTHYDAAVLADPRTADQQRLFDVVNMLAAYSVARQMLSPSAMFTVQRVSDGRAEIERFAASNFDRVRSGVEATYGQLLKRLKGLLASMDPTATIPTAVERRFMGSVGLAINPVTGA